MTTATARSFTWKRRSRDTDHYETVDVWVRGRRVEITASPTGRSIHVHIDGKPWKPIHTPERFTQENP